MLLHYKQKGVIRNPLLASQLWKDKEEQTTQKAKGRCIAKGLAYKTKGEALAYKITATPLLISEGVIKTNYNIQFIKKQADGTKEEVKSLERSYTNISKAIKYIRTLYR